MRKKEEEKKRNKKDAGITSTHVSVGKYRMGIFATVLLTNLETACNV